MNGSKGLGGTHTRDREIGSEDRQLRSGYWPIYWEHSEVPSFKAVTPAASDAIAYAAARIYDEAEELLLSKQDDYGPDAIARSPLGPLFGILVRMHDKQQRAVHLLGKDANHESLEDTFRDILNYSVIALLCLRGEWPGVPKP